MAEQDALGSFDWSKMGAGLFVKFEAGKPLTLRVLTTDPLVTTVEYEDKNTGEITLSTKFAFVVYNFTDQKAQILQATPAMARKIGDLHVDPDFGANIRKIDIKISPTGEKLERRYDIQVLPKAQELSQEQIKEAQEIKLEDKVENGQRMSIYDPAPARAKAVEQAQDEAEPDRVIEDIPDEEPINLDDIPFG